MEKKLCLIDGSGYIFRAFYAIPPMNRSDGVPVNAIYGFTNMLWQIINNFDGTHLAVVFDSARQTFRTDIYPQYKANRRDTPPELIPQFPFFRECVQAFNLPSLEMVGFEADDYIATLTRIARADGMQVEILSADKDLMQLMGDGVTLIDPMKNKRLTPDDVLNKFGVTPDKVVDVQACMGDTSDNVPGFPGIGVKTAAELINHFGSLEQLIARATEIKQDKRRQIIMEHAELALISKQLVLLRDDMPIDISLNDLSHHKADFAKVGEFFKKMEFKSLLNRVPQSHASHAPVMVESGPANETIKQDYQLIDTTEKFDALLQKIQYYRQMVVDSETTHLTPAFAQLVGLSVALNEGEAYYIPCGHGTISNGDDLFAPKNDYAQLPLEMVIQGLKPYLESPFILKIGQNIKYDWAVLQKYGVNIGPYHDTMLISACLNAGQHGHGLDELAKIYCDYSMMSYKSLVGSGKEEKKFNDLTPNEALFYAAEDADFTLRIYNILYPRLIREKLLGFYQEIEQKLPPIIGQMELHGVLVDKGALAKLSEVFLQKITTISAEIYQLAGQEFNIASPKQLGEILYGKLQINPNVKTAKDATPSTAIDVLEPLADEYPIIAKILQFRHYSKLRNTYTELLPTFINPQNERIHCHYSLVGAQTGRLSCSDPNLQNIPIKDDDGKAIRACFIAPKDRVLISLDYSQIELRVLAQMAHITPMLQGFAQNADIHRLTAAKLHQINPEDVTPEQRRSAKAINFGIIYGMSAFGLAKQLQIPQSQAKDFISQYNSEFSGIAQFMNDQIMMAREFGFVRTMAGRRIAIKYINDKNNQTQRGAERVAMNAPIQGSAADIVKCAMIKMAINLPADCQLLLQVHDELVIESPKKTAEANAVHCQNIMEQAHLPNIPFTIPLKVDYTIKTHWD